MIDPNFVRSQTALQQLRQNIECLSGAKDPYQASLVAMQHNVIDHYQQLHAFMHAADLSSADLASKTVLGVSPKEIYSWHEAWHKQACVAALPYYHKSSAKFEEECKAGVGVAERRQRYAISFGRDEALVDTDGVTDAFYASETFVGLSEVASLPGWQDKLFFLQGEGPHPGPAAKAYILAGIRYARRVGCARVLFVNVATDQVDFSSALVEHAETQKMQCGYLALPWPDGARIDPVAVVRHAQAVASAIHKARQPLVVAVNCYGGLDRSGLTLALAHLSVAHQQQCFTSGHASDVWMREQTGMLLRNMKMARPRAITTPARALLLFEAAQALSSPKPSSIAPRNPAV